MVVSGRRGCILRIAIGITALVLLLAGGAGGVPVEEWNRTFWGDYIHSVQQTSDGRYILAGTTDSYSATGGDAHFIKVSSDADAILSLSKISSVVKNTTAIITWVTNSFSDSMIKYGLSTGNYTFMKYINDSVISHNVTLNNLSPDTNYYFVVNSKDATGSTQSDEKTFWTPYDNFQGNLNITDIEIKQLTDYEERANHPVWIGDKIFYASNISGNMDVWMMDKDGSNKTQITNSTADEYPSDSWVSWENNSTIYKILYVLRTNGSSDIWLMNGDGSNKVRLTNDSYENLNPKLVSAPAPVIFGMQPSDTINNNVPLINASYYSNYGNISKVNISVDGFDVTQFANISISNLSYIPAEPLKMGWHNFTVSVETDRYTKSIKYQFFNIRYIFNTSPLCVVFTNTPSVKSTLKGRIKSR